MDLPEEERRAAGRGRPCEVAGHFDASRCLDLLRLGFATAALRGKAVEDHRSPKRWRVHEDTRNPRSVLECASPLALWPQCGENGRRVEMLSAKFECGCPCPSACDRCSTL